MWYESDCKYMNYDKEGATEEAKQCWREVRDRLYEDIRDKKYVEKHRLRKCSAWVYVIDPYSVVLMSYDTIVAFKNKNFLYRFGRYSSTTYQHQRKFFQDWCRDVEFIMDLCIDDWYK